MMLSVFQRCRRIRKVGTIDLVDPRGYLKTIRTKAAILIDESHYLLEN